MAADTHTLAELPDLLDKFGSREIHKLAIAVVSKSCGYCDTYRKAPPEEPVVLIEMGARDQNRACKALDAFQKEHARRVDDAALTSAIWDLYHTPSVPFTMVLHRKRDGTITTRTHDGLYGK